MTEKNWPVMTEIPVLWGDMDAFGHVNNIIYLKWCETSRIELFCKIWDLDGLKMDEILDTNVVTHSKNVKSGVGPILANFNTNYRIPVACPDTIYVKTRINIYVFIRFINRCFLHFLTFNKNILGQI